MSEFSQGEIWLVRIAFEDPPGSNIWKSKVRPAIVVGKYVDNSVIVIEGTRHPPRCKFDFVLDWWEEYGLPAPTTARVSKIRYVPKAVFVEYLDDCHRSDWRKIKYLLDKLFF